MIDLKALRENPARFALGAKAKGVSVDIEKLLKLDEQKRHITIEREKLRAEQNRLSKEAGPQIGKLQGQLKGAHGEARDAIEKQLEELGDQVSDEDRKLIEDAIKDVRDSLEASEDVDLINSKAEALQSAFHTVSEKVYQSAQAGAAAGDGEAGTSSDEEEVIDAEVVDEDEDR
jgi:seryl-tRNA synthetase